MSRLTSTLLACALVLVAISLAACGGDDSTTEADVAAGSVVPEPAETIDEFADRFIEAAAAAKAGDCDAVDEFNDQATWLIQCPEVKDAYTDVEVVETGEYGTGGVVDITSKAYPDGYTVLAALNEDGRFRMIWDSVAELAGNEFPQAGTQPDETAERDQTVDEIIVAIREQDCDTWFELAATPTDDKEKECRYVFGPKADWAEQLEADPDARPELLGETEGFAFYGLETDDVYRTLMTERVGDLVREQDPDAPPYLVHSYRAQD